MVALGPSADASQLAFALELVTLLSGKLRISGP